MAQRKINGCFEPNMPGTYGIGGKTANLSSNVVFLWDTRGDKLRTTLEMLLVHPFAVNHLPLTLGSLSVIEVWLTVRKL